jgi:hypothetical protein
MQTDLLRKIDTTCIICPNVAGLDFRSFERQIFVEFILSAVW